jgi:hypothetical protein
VLWVGGNTPTRRIAEIARSAGIELVVPSDAPGFGIELKLSDIERATV